MLVSSRYVNFNTQRENHVSLSLFSCGSSILDKLEFVNVGFSGEENQSKRRKKKLKQGENQYQKQPNAHEKARVLSQLKTEFFLVFCLAKVGELARVGQPCHRISAQSNVGMPRVTKNCCVTWNIHEYANLVSNFRAYLISLVTVTKQFI